MTIEGIANATGQIKYCYPSLPSYATAAYNTGLAEPPSGGPSRWEIERHKIMVGTFRLVFRPGVGPIELLTTRPPAISELNEEIDTSETAWDHAITNTQAGIAVDSIVYCDRETAKVTAATGGSETITALTRAWGGSTAQAHADKSDLFLSPPTLVGRLVTVYEVAGNAVSSASETVVLRGYIAGPPGAGLHWTTIECVERYERGTLNDSPKGLGWRMRRLAGGGEELDLFERLSGAGGTLGLPRGGAGAGGYWYLPAVEVVVEGVYDATTGHWTPTGRRVVGELPTAEEQPNGNLLAYPILFADERQSYASFGYIPFGGSFTRSDNPAIIALNLLLSLNQTNYTASLTNYDLGGLNAGGIHPEFALGVPVAQVDVAAFERAAFVDLADVHARHFWLGGNRSEPLADVLYRLLAPWGYAVGTTRAGVWTLLRLGDVYPTATTVAITTSHIELSRIHEVRIQAIGRALDRVVLECNPSPSGESLAPQTVEEVAGRAYYPRHTGAEERFRDCPYDANDFVVSGDDRTRSHVYDLIANRVQVLADQVPVVRVPLNTTLFGAVNIGTAVSIVDVALRDPTTGLRLAAGATGLRGLCTDVQPDWRTRTLLVTIALMGNSNVATMSPSAKVVSWDAGTLTATVEIHQVTDANAASDGARFAVGEVCALVDSRFVLRSDNGLTQTLPTVVSLPSNTEIDFGITFKDTGGATVTPAAGNWIVFASYDACVAGQKTAHGFDADGGDAAVGNNPPDLGAANAAPYRIGF